MITFSDQIALIYVVPDYTASYQDFLKMRKVSQKLELYKQYDGPNRMSIRKKLFTMNVDAIDYYTEKLQLY